MSRRAGWLGGVVKRLTGRRDERGAILVMASMSMVVVLVMASMAIDLGTVAQTARRNQLVADMAALDAARVLPANPTSTAQASATRNSFPYATSGYGLLVEWAPTTIGPFTSVLANLPTATAVRVSATSPHRNFFPFVGDGDAVTRRSISLVKPIAGFSIGSSLLNVNSSSSALLNPLMTDAIGGNVNLSLVSWQGLASGTVGLTALQTQLATMGFSVGTVSQLLSADMTLAQLYQATASALTAQGDTANAALLNTLRIAATSSVLVSLGDLITVAQGGENAALSTSLSLLQLVTGGALVINGTNSLDITTAVTVPGVTSTAISLKVTELPQVYIGPVGGSVSTGQVQLVVTPTLNLDLSLGLNLVKVTGSIPVRLELAGATGTLTAATCSGITVSADPHAFAGTVQSAPGPALLEVWTLGLLRILRVGMTSLTPSINGPAQNLTFTYPAQFAPPAFSKHAGSQPIGLQGLTTFTAGSVSLINSLIVLSLGQTTAGIVGSVVSALSTVIGNVDSNVLTPLLTALGVDVGGADVTAIKSALQCLSPALGG